MSTTPIRVDTNPLPPLPPEPGTPGSVVHVDPPSHARSIVGAILLSVAMLGGVVGYAVHHPATKTPASCIQALDLASQGFSAASDGFTAASHFDAAGMSAASDRMSAIAGPLGVASTACRGSA